MKKPWLKFYPSDWRADPALRSCSIAARGLWVEMLGIMHESTRRGVLLVNDLSPTSRQLATIVGCDLKEMNKLLSELESAGVFSRHSNGEIYSRRMIRDEEKSEVDKANGKLGGNPAVKGGVNPQSNGEDKAHILEARVQSLDKKENSLRSPKKKPSISFPDNFTPDETSTKAVEDVGMNAADIQMEILKMRDWAKSKDEKKADWQAAFRNWIREAAKRNSKVVPIKSYREQLEDRAIAEAVRGAL